MNLPFLFNLTPYWILHHNHLPLPPWGVTSLQPLQKATPPLASIPPPVFHSPLLVVSPSSSINDSAPVRIRLLSDLYYNPSSATSSLPTPSPIADSQLDMPSSDPAAQTIHTHPMVLRPHPNQPSALTTIILTKESICFTQASKHPEWHAAITEKFNALVHNGTWSLVPRSSHQ